MTKNDDDILEQATRLTSGQPDKSDQYRDAFVSKQVQVLYDNVSIALFGTLAAATFIAYFFLGEANTAYLLTWYGAVMLISLLRFALLLTFRNVTSLQSNHGWLVMYDVGACLSGVAWGIAPLLILPEGSFIHLIILVFVIGGLSAGAVATYSVSLYASVLFSVTAITPLLLTLHMSNQPFSLPMEVLIAMFLAAMVVLARRQYKASHENIVIALQNQGLVNNLTDSLQETSKLNKQLVSEIEQRKKAEQAALNSELRIRNLSDATFEGILIHDQGKILDVNNAVAKMTGHERHELTGRSILEIAAPECHDKIKSRLARPSEEKLELIGLRKDGSRFPAEISARDYNYLGRDARVVAIRDLTKVRATEHSLRMSEQRVARYMQQALVAVVEWDVDFTVSDWNPAAEKIFGYTREEAIGSNAYDLILPEASRKNARRIWSDMIKNGKPNLFTYENTTKDSRIITCEWDVTPVLNDDGVVTSVVSLAHDITERVNAEKALFHEKELAEVTLSSLGDGVITTNSDGEIDYINPVAEILIGWKLDLAHGRHIDEIFIIENEKTGMRYEGLSDLAMGDNTRDFTTRHTILIQRSGDTVPIVFTGSPLRNYNKEIIGSVIVFRDVSDLRQLENRLSFEASHDSLTGLINRREFEERLSQAIKVASRGQEQHALLYLDLDQFKVVNDTCGHIAGDELLRQLSSQLCEIFPETDSLARLGGDEFGVLLNSCPLERAEETAHSVRNLVGRFRFTWDNKTFDSGVSIGVVPITATSGNMASVLSSADTACYVAKEQGRNRVHVYREDDTAVAERHGEMQWVHRINDAISDDRIILYVQMITGLHGHNKSSHYEILMRMLDENGDIVPPMAFIPAAERYDMMTQLDRHVVRKAFSSIVALDPQSFETTIFSINLSGQSLCSNDFLEFVISEISESGVTPDRICFEVTETAAIGNLSHAKRFISILRDMGCSFSLDDFGSGLSSFGYLKNLDVTYLKIDGSFVRDMVNDKVDEAMVQSIHQVGKVLGMQTIAEFVEDNRTVVRLREIGVDYAQGFGIERPKPISKLLSSS